jgi:hypothetical protein
LHCVRRLTRTRWYFLWNEKRVLYITSIYLPWHRWIDNWGYLFRKHSRSISYESLPLGLSFCWCLRRLTTHACVTCPTFFDVKQVYIEYVKKLETSKRACALYVAHNCYRCTLSTCIVSALESLWVYLLENYSSTSSGVAHKTSSSCSISLFLSM